MQIVRQGALLEFAVPVFFVKAWKACNGGLKEVPTLRIPKLSLELKPLDVFA
jgi:hypothetical protein